MANGFQIQYRVITKDTRRQFGQIDKVTARATMWTVRDLGRKTKQAAKKAAPVYKGPQRQVYKQGGGAVGPLVPRTLKNSIKSSRRLKTFGANGFSVKVGPRGAAWRYGGAQEDRFHFMAEGRKAADRQAYQTGRKAWLRAIKNAQRR